VDKLVDKAKGFVADKVAHMQKPEVDLADLSVSCDDATLVGCLDVRNRTSFEK
jgi:hypothetical protein